MSTISLRDALTAANEQEVLSLLSRAHITAGHLKGRHIHVDGYTSSVTFSDFSSRAEELYEEKILPMRKLADEYFKAVGLDNHFKQWGINEPSQDVPTAYFKTLLKKPAPQLSKEQLEKYSDIILWRKEIDAQLSKLFLKSQVWINAQAHSPFSWGNVVKKWDSLCDSRSSWRILHLDDFSKFRWIKLAQDDQQLNTDQRIKQQFEIVLGELRNTQDSKHLKEKSETKLLNSVFKALESVIENKDFKHLVEKYLLEKLHKECEGILEKKRLGQFNIEEEEAFQKSFYEILGTVVENEKSKSVLDQDFLTSIYQKIGEVLKELHPVTPG